METADTLAQGRSGQSSLQVNGVGTVTMRPLMIDDLPAMQRLLGRCAANRGEATVEIIIGSLDWRPARARTLTLGAVDEDADQLLGVAGLTADGRIDRGARFGLLVDPDCRQRGIGHALLGALIRAAERAGYQTLRGPASNGEAAIRALARQAGFALRRVDGDDPIVLERTLAPARSSVPAAERRLAGHDTAR